jgi:hypothetical protein
MEFTQEDRELIEKTYHSTGIILERLGENGRGLCGTVERQGKILEAHAKDIRQIYMILAFAAGGGGVTGGIIGISKLLGG